MIVVVTTLILFLSLFAIWVKRQALETDTWTETSSELLENEEIRDAIAGFLVTASTTTSTSRRYRNCCRRPSTGSPVDLGGPAPIADEAANRALARPEGSNALGGGEQDRTEHMRP